MKKGDKLILIILVLLLGSWYGLKQYGQKVDASKIVISVDGELYKTLTMNSIAPEGQTIRIERPEGKYMDLFIDKTGSYVVDVICPDKLCQKTGKIEQVGQSIVCLPNRIVVEITGKTSSDVDQVSY